MSPLSGADFQVADLRLLRADSILAACGEPLAVIGSPTDATPKLNPIPNQLPHDP